MSRLGKLIIRRGLVQMPECRPSRSTLRTQGSVLLFLLCYENPRGKSTLTDRYAIHAQIVVYLQYPRISRGHSASALNNSPGGTGQPYDLRILLQALEMLSIYISELPGNAARYAPSISRPMPPTPSKMTSDFKDLPKVCTPCRSSSVSRSASAISDSGLGS